MAKAILFAIIGYFSGSVLYANVFGTLFKVKDQYLNSPDKNPGTANAYKYGGFWCGTLTLLCDLLKGFLPVFLYLRAVPSFDEWGLSLVIAAPVAGHIYPFSLKFRGGKGIATTFGCLLGLLPQATPVLIFAGAFVFLSVGLRISPNYYRTLIAYLVSAVGMIISGVAPAVWVSFLLITVAVGVRLLLSKEEKERLEVKLLWMR